MEAEKFACLLCGSAVPGGCGRACVHDPKRANGLLFWPDGRAKTLKERGLGWDDPAPAVAGVTKRRRAVNVTESNKGVESNKVLDSGDGDDFDRVAYQREYMRKRRAALRALKVAERKMQRKVQRNPPATKPRDATKPPATETTPSGGFVASGKKGGRPKKEGALSSTERARRRREALRLVAGKDVEGK